MSLAAVLWSGATLATYALARGIYQRWRLPLLHPSLLGVVILAVTIEALGRSYPEYAAATKWIAWWAGPAVVAMAIPIWRLRALLRARLPIVVAVVVAGLAGGFLASTTTLRLLGQPRDVQLAGPLQSITSPVAIPLGVQIGARSDALVIGVLTAGLLGATVGPALLRRIGVRDRRARGLAMGCGSHAIGVSRSLEVDAVCGAFATLGMMGNAVLATLIYPLLARWW